jgi:nitrite reductase/ring-hydroxylating ferredoxin subunit
MHLCHLDALPDGGARGFDPQRRGQDSLLLVRRGRQVFAWADACPHHGTPLAWRKDAYLNASADRIVCAAHGALFEIDSGLCTLGPCLGDRLQALPITLTADGAIHLADTTFQETP